FGVEYGVLGGLIGVSVAEFGSLLILLVSKQVVTHKQRKKAKGNKEQSPQENGFAKGAVLYAKDKHILASEMAIEMDMSELDASQYTKDTDTVQLSTKSILSKLCKFALPITIGALILPMVQLLDSFVVIRFLMGKGLAIQNATAQFGVINGPVSSLVNMPVVITMALAVALMPKIAKEFKSKKVGDKDNQDDLSQEESKSKDNAEEKPADGIVRDVFQNYRFACVFSSLVALLLLLFAREIMQVLYNKGLDPQEMVQGVQLLRILSIVVVYISLLQISTAVMQGVGKPTLPTLFLGIGAVLKCIVGYSLMVWYGIYGILIATVVFYSFAALCNIVYIRKKGILIQGEKTFFVRLLLVVGVSGAVGWLCQALLSPLLTDVWSLFVGGAAVCMVFLVATLVTKVFGIKDFVQIVGVK
ncbi:MAG: polysaccharide biosynthesis C-terminal domain-containing protein, partial [Firmicutes bacterium]|nr:polysaccharide biosynthesis C-terminal domain-containing protein [Bacillota bacterium]